MSDQPRALPDRPNLRFLKIEAKRRHEAGEFATLHDAQLAIAREHGRPSWTALKRIIEDGHALTQVRWVLDRFGGAGTDDWAAPDETELRAHFAGHFLDVIPPAQIVSTLSGIGERLRGELVVDVQTPLQLRARIGAIRVEAVAAADPPHRLTGLRFYRTGTSVSDPRAAGPRTQTEGEPPAPAVRLAEDSAAELGVPGLILAGSAGDGTWAVAHGRADLNRDVRLRPDHPFPAYSITKLVTAVAVLRLVADGRIGLDDPANAHLRTVTLADGAVTVRDLLAHTGGVAGPEEVFADRVPAAPADAVLDCPGPRGVFAYSNGGYEALGALIAAVTGGPYADAATGLVLRPLGMAGSWYPDTWPAEGITGYALDRDGRYVPEPPQVCRLPAAGGLWTTAADLIRFARSWASLLPGDLAREALRPQAVRDETGAQIGLGWLLNRAANMRGHAGAGPGATASLIVRSDTGAPTVALANRQIPIEPVNARLAAGLG